MKKLNYVSRSAEQTRAFGRKISAGFTAGDTVFLRGPIGAGKTTLAKGILHFWGISEDEVVSPSFVYARLYEQGRIPVFHLDLYRMDEASQVLDVDYVDIMRNDRALVVIEWPQRLSDAYLPEHYFEVQLEIVDLETRKISLKKK